MQNSDSNFKFKLQIKFSTSNFNLKRKTQLNRFMDRFIECFKDNFDRFIIECFKRFINRFIKCFRVNDQKNKTIYLLTLAM